MRVCPIGGEVVPEIVEVNPLSPPDERLRRRTVEAKMPDAGIVVDGFPSGDTGEERVHDHELCGFGGIHCRVGVSDHQADIVPDHLRLLKTKRRHQRVDADSRRLHIQTVRRYGGVAYPWQIRRDDGESLREGWHQGPPHQRGLCVAVEQEKGRTVTGVRDSAA